MFVKSTLITGKIPTTTPALLIELFVLIITARAARSPVGHLPDFTLGKFLAIFIHHLKSPFIVWPPHGSHPHLRRVINRECGNWRTAIHGPEGLYIARPKRFFSSHSQLIGEHSGRIVYQPERAEIVFVQIRIIQQPCHECRHDSGNRDLFFLDQLTGQLRLKSVYKDNLCPNDRRCKRRDDGGASPDDVVEDAHNIIGTHFPPFCHIPP